MILKNLPKVSITAQHQQEFDAILAGEWKRVPGQIKMDEAAAIYHYARLASKDVLEIGCWKGKSTTLIGLAMKASNNTHKLICIDPFEGVQTQMGKDTTPHPTLQAFQNNIAKFGTGADYLIGSSFDPVIVKHVYAKLPILSILWIDGLHSYEACKADLTNYWPLLEIGGKLMIHDMDRRRWYPGLSQLSDELQLGKGIDQPELTSSLLVLTKTDGTHPL